MLLLLRALACERAAGALASRRSPRHPLTPAPRPNANPHTQQQETARARSQVRLAARNEHFYPARRRAERSVTPFFLFFLSGCRRRPPHSRARAHLQHTTHHQACAATPTRTPTPRSTPSTMASRVRWRVVARAPAPLHHHHAALKHTHTQQHTQQKKPKKQPRSRPALSCR